MLGAFQEATLWVKQFRLATFDFRIGDFNRGTHLFELFDFNFLEDFDTGSIFGHEVFLWFSCHLGVCSKL